jgi:hypothetical protein
VGREGEGVIVRRGRRTLHPAGMISSGQMRTDADKWKPQWNVSVREFINVPSAAIAWSMALPRSFSVPFFIPGICISVHR